MATYTKIKLSGTPTSNRPAFTSDLLVGRLHVASLTDLDEIWLWASNVTTNDEILSVDFLGSGMGFPFLEVTVPAKSTALILAGLPITDGETVQVSSPYYTIAVYGYVNRIA